MCERSGLIIPNLVVTEEKKRRREEVEKGGEPTIVKLFFTDWPVHAACRGLVRRAGRSAPRSSGSLINL